MSKKKNVIARVGNFEIVKENGSGHSYVRIKAVNGHWSLMHRDDSVMYGAWLEMCKSPDYKPSMEVLLVMTYALTTQFVDAEFAQDFFKAWEGLMTRRAEAAPEPTEEENQRAIAEVKMMEAVKEAFQGSALSESEGNPH